MDSAETKLIIHHTDQAVERIRHRININSAIFLITFVIACAIGLKLWSLTKTMTASAAMAQNSATEIIEIKNRQELYRQQYLNYIKDMIEAMNAFQKNNPKLKVPRVPVPGVPSQDTTESDLRRLPQPGPPPPDPHSTPTAKPETKTVVKHKKPKDTPTPRPWYDYFKSTR